MNSLRPIILIITAFLSMFISVAVLIFFLSPSSIKSYTTGAPLVPTPKKEIKAALKAVGLTSEDRFFDLGSGTGKSLIIASKDFGAEVVGIDHSRPNVLISRINLKVKKVKGKIICQNLLKTDLREADVIFTYLSPSLMEKLEKKIKKEKVSLRVASYCFSFPGLKEEKVLKTANGKNIFIYDI